MNPRGILKIGGNALLPMALLLAGAWPLPGETVTLPVAASVVRPVAPFFSDVRVFNTSYTSLVTVTAVYRCFGCASAVPPQVFTLSPRESKAFDDISNQLFGVPNSLGAVEFSTPGSDGIVVTSRLYSPLAPPATSGSVGMFIPGLPSSSAKVLTALTNLMNGDFRTNIGVYNPNAVGVTVTLRLFDGPVLLGTVPVTLGPQTGAQVNDIYGQVKFGTLKTTNGYCTVESSVESAPLFTYAAEADNTTQDTIFVIGAEDVPAPPGFNPPTATASPTVPAATPTPTPTSAPTTVVIDLSATQFQWTFTGDGGSGPTLVARVGQTYQLQIRDGDRAGTTAHGFSGIPSLGLSALALTAGGAAKTETFTPSVSQLGEHFFSCSESTCGTGSQHDGMLGTISIVNP
jgi:hypothetical protein